MDKQTGIPVQLSGLDGNIFAIVGRASKAMKRADFREEAAEMTKLVMASKSYSDALDIVGDYVEVS